MIEYVDIDIFESSAVALVNPVNTVGVMGAGLALEFKKRFPDNFEAYRDACRLGLKPGDVFQFRSREKYIFNLATKGHWKHRSRVEWIEKGLRNLRSLISVDPRIKSIALPRLGCGLGELEWLDVRPLIENILDELPIPIPVVVCVPRT